MEKIVLSGLVTAWRRATIPTMRSPVLGLTATTEGKSRPPSALGITVGSPACITAAQQLVVPKSMPIILLIVCCFLRIEVGKFFGSELAPSARMTCYIALLARQ